jgi:uncharacterized protein YkwD
MGTGWGKKPTLIVAAAIIAVAGMVPFAVAAPSDADTVRSLISQARRGHHHGPVGRHPALEKLAQRQAVRMRDARTIFHNTHIGADLSKLAPDWTVVGENVGMGPTVVDIEDAFMHSATHKHNILGRYNAVGVAVARDADGRRYVAQVFAHLDMAVAEDGTPVPPAYYTR